MDKAKTNLIWTKVNSLIVSDEESMLTKSEILKMLEDED